MNFSWNVENSIELPAFANYALLPAGSFDLPVWIRVRVAGTYGINRHGFVSWFRHGWRGCRNMVLAVSVGEETQKIVVGGWGVCLR